MARILTVDDSRSVRMIVARELRALGHDLDEAEDGEKGLEKLEELTFDLVILDITMPVLDGPGMLAKMREAGNKTPVLMLTSESKRSIIANLMKLGIDDYILKPFNAEDLKSKVAKVLRQDIGAPVPVASANEVGRPSAAPGGGGGGAGAAAGGAAGDPAANRAFVDILVIDDMENVQKRLRQMVPEHLSVAGALNAQTAIAACRDRGVRAILIDNDMPDVNSVALMRQVRALQPKAVVLALYVRTSSNVLEAAKSSGFDGVLMKPFDVGAVEDFLLQYFNSQDLVSKDDNVLKVSKFKGRENRLDSYFIEVVSNVTKYSEEIAAACYGEMVLDLSAVPPNAEKVARMMLDLNTRISKMGIEIRLVGSPEIAKTLKQYTETAQMPLYASVDEALRVS
jgi:DNA-binding response OmpR family regulator/anti-anti-sigma regulatory factor